jgi:hypothetical protein
MPESFPINPAPTDPEAIAERRKKWEEQKRSSTKPLPRELSAGHSAEITTAEDFHQRSVSMSAAKNIARQFEKMKEPVFESPSTPSPQVRLESKKTGAPGILQSLRQIFLRSGGTIQKDTSPTGADIASSVNSFLDDAKRNAYRPEGRKEELDRLMRFIEDGCEYVILQLPYLRRNATSQQTQDIFAGYAMRVEAMKEFTDAVRGALDASYFPTEDDLEKLYAFRKEITEMTGDISKHHSGSTNGL